MKTVDRQYAIRAAKSGYLSALMAISKDHSPEEWLSIVALPENQTILGLIADKHPNVAVKMLNIAFPANFQDEKGNNILHYLASKGGLTYMRKAIQEGANINAVNNIGYNPLMSSLSFDKGKEFYVKMLDMGSNERFRSKRGEDCKSIASRFANEGYEEAIKRIKQRHSTPEQIELTINLD